MKKKSRTPAPEETITTIIGPDGKEEVFPLTEEHPILIYIAHTKSARNSELAQNMLAIAFEYLDKLPDTRRADILAEFGLYEDDATFKLSEAEHEALKAFIGFPEP